MDVRPPFILSDQSIIKKRHHQLDPGLPPTTQTERVKSKELYCNAAWWQTVLDTSSINRLVGMPLIAEQVNWLIDPTRQISLVEISLDQQVESEDGRVSTWTTLESSFTFKWMRILFWWCYHSSSDYCHQNYLAKAYKIKSILFFPLADEQEEGESDERLVSVFADNKLGDYAFSLIVSLIIDDRRKGLIIAS